MASFNNLNVMVVGKGAREHALAWKLSQSPRVSHVYTAPGNAGTAHGVPKVSNVDGVSVDDFENLIRLAKKLDIGLTVIGPDDPIVGGIEKHFRDVNIPCFAPTKEAAIIEGSKAFAKDFMEKYSIPTAAYETFSNFEEAKEYVLKVTHSVVIKVDGLAAGKGVIIPGSKDEAVTALRAIMTNRCFGSAGDSVVIEEFLDGQEISVSTFSDGRTTRSLSPAQDHKRIFEGDKGPNTGGMGVYAPLPAATSAIMDLIEREVLVPTFEGLRKEGRTFVGLLFTGIMLTSRGPKVLEYNARFGDPETQTIIPLLSDEVDLAEVMFACINGTLNNVQVPLRNLFACNVVIAAGGYPNAYKQGDEIHFKSLPQGCLLFHAGTKLEAGKVVTAGGRVLTVVGLGTTLKEAVATAYQGVASVQFSDMFFRTDIAYRALSASAAK